MPRAKVKRVYGFLCKAEELVAGVLLTLVLIVIAAAATARSVGYPLRWGMDMATFLFGWFCFLSADTAMRNDRHVSVRVLVDKLPKKTQSYISLVNHLIILVFLAYLVGYGAWLSYNTRFRAFQGIPGFSYMWATLSVPVGSLLLLSTTIGKIRRIIEAIKTESQGSLRKKKQQEVGA